MTRSPDHQIQKNLRSVRRRFDATCNTGSPVICCIGTVPIQTSVLRWTKGVVRKAFPPTFPSPMVVRRRSQSRVGTENPPDEIFCEIAAYSLSSPADLCAFSAVSRRFFNAALTTSQDVNAPLWAACVRAADPILYAGIVHAKDTRRSWQSRLFHLRQLQRECVADPSPQLLSDERHQTHVLSPPPSSVSDAACVDVILYNHPTQGFMMNVGEVRHKVCIYGLRQQSQTSPVHGGDSGASGSDLRPAMLTSAAKLSRFRVPTYPPGAPAPLGPATTNLLVLLSLNGKKMADFDDFHDLVRGIKAAPEFCRWRFLFYPASNLRKLPPECSLGGPARASNPPADGDE